MFADRSGMEVKDRISKNEKCVRSEWFLEDSQADRALEILGDATNFNIVVLVTVVARL